MALWVLYLIKEHMSYLPKICFVFFLILAGKCFAAEKIILSDEIPKSEKENVNIHFDIPIMIISGLTQRYFIHEWGHSAGAGIIGKEIDQDFIETGDWELKSKITNEDRKIIYSSGMISSMLFSEILLDAGVSKNNPVVVGSIIGTFIHHVCYAIWDSFLKKEGEDSDFGHMEEAGLSRNITYPIALLIPAIQTYRVLNSEEFSKKLGLWWGGDSIGIEYRF
jgi:hypothetical protein